MVHDRAAADEQVGGARRLVVRDADVERLDERLAAERLEHACGPCTVSPGEMRPLSGVTTEASMSLAIFSSIVVMQMNLDALDLGVAELVRHQVAGDDGEILRDRLARLRAGPAFAKTDRLEALELDLRLEHHGALACRALRVGDDAVGGHRQDQRRELRVADDVDVIRLRRAGAVRA